MALLYNDALQILEKHNFPANGVKMSKNIRLYQSYNSDCCIVGWKTILVRIRADGVYHIAMGYEDWNAAKAKAIKRYSPANVFKKNGCWRIYRFGGREFGAATLSFDNGTAVKQTGAVLTADEYATQGPPRRVPALYWSTDSGEFSISLCKGTKEGEEKWRQLVMGSDGELINATESADAAHDTLAETMPTNQFAASAFILTRTLQRRQVRNTTMYYNQS